MGEGRLRRLGLMMKLDSKYFDCIRVSRADRAHRAADSAGDGRHCEWRGCQKLARHRAPKGRALEGQYYYFCRDHVAQYNKSYNYFAGMGDEDVAQYQKSAVTGHRPTWSLGVNGAAMGTFGAMPIGEATPCDPLEVLRAMRGKVPFEPAPPPKRRLVQKGAMKHLLALNLDETAAADEIRARFKALVKLHHPDHNGGDRSSEERLREVIAAYNYLKQSGLC